MEKFSTTRARRSAIIRHHILCRLTLTTLLGVLWLTRINPNLQQQLVVEAQAHGITNILLHDQVPTDDMMAGGHLSVRRLADIAVDTPGYNGHTTVTFSTPISENVLLFPNEMIAFPGSRTSLGWSSNCHYSRARNNGISASN